jgi:hypothetical protein
MPGNEADTLEPDTILEPTYDDWLQGRDAVLEHVLEK